MEHPSPSPEAMDLDTKPSLTLDNSATIDEHNSEPNTVDKKKQKDKKFLKFELKRNFFEKMETVKRKLKEIKEDFEKEQMALLREFAMKSLQLMERHNNSLKPIHRRLSTAKQPLCDIFISYLEMEEEKKKQGRQKGTETEQSNTHATKKKKKKKR
ncbi:hypothetical protein RFI_21973 [Reticulomyxa filosa]|uniref:Uncharacterized protein n=1 Tax=Reticulomyxa filosa TaxID=46433 RepID=X6MQQ0_RETFI|nr:hypothetical protein RFI_21973 [Reticulomyxa filosa]|eukprot:ETO15390.1 hypothetical protein RFI_21973 [Reticulomyxa filosa]